ncbi:pilus assembly protein PilM [Pseudarthrobacter sp. BIM B-2242]|uniref:pilus assembly protein PilM n=1 Tax=Pseudarthrobacter sp. BIM B-2242 TaxID=2772401 RepID=UPI00168A9589|nr:pilus assembly protein PilM [Pseudarthrobacter sp. BIM B-2242]QOD05719.1 pilus assembly protein PilM [Pseudarthrobacter sp. BIM B-2242]
MAEKVLGIDFGATGIKIAEVQTVKDTVTVLRQLFMPLETGLVHRGLIEPEDVARIANELKMFLSSRKVATRDVIMGVGAVDEVYVNRTVTNWHDQKDFHTAMGFELTVNPDLLPGAREGVLLDAVVFGELEDDEGRRKLDTLLIGVAPDVVNTQLQVIQKAGLRIAGSDLTAFGLLRAIALPARPAGQLDLLVDIGHEVVTAIIHEGGRPYAVALQKGAGGSDADAVVEMAIQYDDPEKIHEAKTTPSGDPVIHKALQDYAFKVFTAIQEAIISYEVARPDSGAKIQGITLTGGGALLRTLPKTLQNSFRVPVEIGVLDESIAGEDLQRYTPNGKSNACCAAAVGLAMGATV